jgi:hypothetical protein
MDAGMKYESELTQQALRAADAGEAEAWMPPEAPLAMPAQALTGSGSAGLVDWLRLVLGRRTV